MNGVKSKQLESFSKYIFEREGQIMEKAILISILVIVIIVILFTVSKLTSNSKNKKVVDYIIENVHVISGDGKEQFNKNVLISGKKIMKIADEKISVKNSEVIDGTGKTLMPGLIDSHMHIQGITNTSEKESDEFLENILPKQLYSLLENGVTTIKELGAPESFIYKLRDKLSSNEILGPNLLIVGPNITGKGGHPAVTLGGNNPWIRNELAEEVEDEEQARQSVKRLAEKEVDFIKIVYQGGEYYYFDKELTINKLDIKLVKAIIDEAKKCNLKVTAHVMHEDDVLELLETDIYGLEHGVIDKYISDGDKVMELLKSKGVYYVPTIQVLTGEHDKNVIKYGMHNLKKMHDYGVKIALGTDNMLEFLPGNIVHKELEYYVDAGLTEMEALVTATHNSAEYLGILDTTGTVEEGKKADLILLDSNPLEDIQNINNINAVFKDGDIVYSKANSNQIVLDEYTFPSYEELIYTDNTLQSSKNTLEKKYALDQFKGSGTIKLNYLENNNSIIQETFKTKNNLETTQWSYIKLSDGTDIKADVNGYSVTLTGKFKNKEVNKKFRLDSFLWMQINMFDLCSFAKSNHDKISYYSIGTEGRGALSWTKFESQKEGEETIEIGGKEYECIKIATVISEYSFIWKGYSWHDKETGVLIKYITKGQEKNALFIKE